MEKIKQAFLIFELLKPFWPIVVIPLIIGIIRLFVTEGFENTIHILKRLIIAIALIFVIYILLVIFI